MTIAIRRTAVIAMYFFFIAQAVVAETPRKTIKDTPVSDTSVNPPVTVTEEGGSYVLANGILTARVSKRSGDLVSLRYKDIETLGGGSGHVYGYWSHDTSSKTMNDTITIDPDGNGGQRGEVSVKGISNGAAMGHGPGGGTLCDIEIRYSLGRGDSGIYTYCVFDHKAEYPGTSIGEARFAVKLNDEVFDWMTIDANRNKLMPRPEDWDQGTQLNMKEVRRMNTGVYAGQVEHKYDYSAVQFDIPAFGWSSTKKQIGLWFINPTIEYLSGGATKVELTGHLDNNQGGAPTLLNYWRGSHYGGTRCDIAKDESWTKTIGPFLIYCNSAAMPDDMWRDALARAKKEADAWPYEWVAGVDYPHKNERGSVTGRIILKDPQAPDAKMANLLVGLAHPDYTPRGGGGRSGGGGFGGGFYDPFGFGMYGMYGGGYGGGFGGMGRFARGPVDWQNDAKYYQFWVRGDAQGRFSIPNIRPGTYTLHAIADGVLGEYAKTNITVESGKNLDLGDLQWQPVRHGKQLWDIGIPDRSAAEFLHGDHFWQWGLYNDYPQDFPDDVNFVIGKSDYRKDWNYCQCPRADRPDGTTWSVTFDLSEAPRGKATLRLALAGVGARNISATVNDQPAGKTGPLMNTTTIIRDGIRGYWTEKDITFDAALMKPGENVLKLTIPAGRPTSGVEYDYLRLEVDETKEAETQK